MCQRPYSIQKPRNRPAFALAHFFRVSGPSISNPNPVHSFKIYHHTRFDVRTAAPAPHCRSTKSNVDPNPQNRSFRPLQIVLYGSFHDPPFLHTDLQRSPYRSLRFWPLEVSQWLSTFRRWRHREVKKKIIINHTKQICAHIYSLIRVFLNGEATETKSIKILKYFRKIWIRIS